VTGFAEVWARRSIPLVIAALTLVACTGGGADRQSAPTESAAIALMPDAQHYSAIVAPIDPAVDSFATESGALPVGASVDDFVVIARPFANTVADVDSKLRQVKWPAVALHDIKAELTADQSLRTDLIGTADVTLILPLWRHQVISAAKRATDAKRTVSIDLGLVAPSAA
jgi:hypothetical protein